MKKRILLVLKEEFADWEAAYLSSQILELGKGNYVVETVSLNKETVRSIGGLRVVPDYGLDEVPETYEALILVGGTGWRKPDAGKIAPLVLQCVEKGRVLGGICDAASFLGTLGVLNTVKHTCNDLKDTEAWAKEAYTGSALHQKKQAVRDKKIVTANGTAALEFAREILFALDIAEEKSIMDSYAFFKNGLYKE